MSEGCEQCGVLSLPHTLLPTDCILGHPDHAERWIGYACKRHYHQLGDRLRQIEELFALAYRIPQLGNGLNAERGGTREGSPAPGRLEVMAITDKRAKTPVDLEPGDIPDLPGSLASWARVVVEELSSEDELTGDVSQSVRILLRERKWIAQQDWLDDYAYELAELHRVLAAAVGDTIWPRPIGSCPNCGTPLYNDPGGADVVSCRRCKASWSGVHYARLRLIHKQEERA